jgi:hypothetical protein
MFRMNFNIDEIITEWSYRVHDGMPNIREKEHIDCLREILYDYKFHEKFITELIKRISELEFSNQEEYKKYRASHTIQPDTTVTVGGKKRTPSKTSSDSVDDGEDKDKTTDRSAFDKKSPEHRDNPKGPNRKEIQDDLNKGSLDVLEKYQKGVEYNRSIGIAGAGTAVASEGESKFCLAVNTDFDKFNSDNADAISAKQDEFKDTKKTKDHERAAIALGLDVNSDEFNNYLAKRAVWSEQQLNEAKLDPNSVFYKKDKEGFNGSENDEATAKENGEQTPAAKVYTDWMHAAYDGSQTTKRAIEDASHIDTSKKYIIVQSTAEVNDATQAHLEDSVKSAKTPEDKARAETQLKNFKKFKGYHDTFVIGKDSEGRTSYMGISNKKDGQMKDPQNNAGPKQRLIDLQAGYGKDVAETVVKSLSNNIKKISEVKQDTVKNASKIEVSDNYAAICETKEMKTYIDKLRSYGKFKDYLKAQKPPMDSDKMNTKDLLTAMNEHSKVMQKAGTAIPYNPYGKIAIKVGELASTPPKNFKTNNPNIKLDDESIKSAKDIKDNEKNVVKNSHSAVVNDLVEADKPNGYSKDNPKADNGKHQQGYISGVLDACHIDTYIDMDSDDPFLLQMGINGVKPSMIRNCVGEQSGFKGDSTTSEGKQSLKDHLRKRLRVTPGGSKITINDSSGKSVELFDDTWRTAGTSQKVASGFGKNMRECLQAKAAKK